MMRVPTPTPRPGGGLRPTPSFLATAALIALGMLPLPGTLARSARQTISSPAVSHAERDDSTIGYYEHLLSGAAAEGDRDALSRRLLGKPVEWITFHNIDATHYLKHDLLQFELKPGLDQTLFGVPFTTNRHGLRDRDCSVEKPSGIFRIVLLGSSMDMGWGVGTDETYPNLLEHWLNRHAEARGLPRRFEVLNFAMAAYSPLHRLECYRRKACRFDPDLVIYSATTLDARLLEIHLCGLLQDRVDLGDYDFLGRAVAEAGIGPDDLALRDDGKTLRRKGAVKSKIRPRLWSVADATLGRLAVECRSVGVPLICTIIPRVGPADSPEVRGPAVARQIAVARRHAVPVLDLSATFDDDNPADIEISAWDDHPNALGHDHLFHALVGEIVDDPSLYRTLFDAAPPRRPDGSEYAIRCAAPSAGERMPESPSSSPSEGSIVGTTHEHGRPPPQPPARPRGRATPRTSGRRG